MGKTFFEKRPWGNFRRFTLNEKTTVKILTVKPKQILSLQSHKKRSEQWAALTEGITVTVGSKKTLLKKLQSIFIPKGARHRIQNNSSKEAMVLEISFGKFEENDIKRFEDKYGRAKKK
ncbi:MAG: phosphomannose isomerase type II C-terminal cupin domain [Candidatus Diapherotrites archaeon]